jgi:O-antigen/teichoic acid export membrane protein
MNLARSSIYVTGVNVGIACLTAAGFFFLAINLSPEQLGTLSVLIAVPSIGQCLLSFSYHKAAIYYIGRKTFSIETVIANGLIFCLLQGLVLGLGLALSKSYLERVFPDISFGIIALAVFSIPIQIFLYYLTEACIAAEYLAVMLTAKVISPILYVVGCVLAGMRDVLSAELAFVFYVLGISLSNLIGLAYLFLVSQSKSHFWPDGRTTLICLKFGGKAQIGEVAQFLALRMDLILVGFWAGLHASGYYSVAVRLAEAFWLVAYSIQIVFSAKVAQGVRESLSDKGTRLGRAVRYMIVGSILGGLGMIAASYIVFKFFLTQYQPAFLLLVALTPGQIALAVFLVLIGNLIGDGFPMLATKLRVLFFFLSLIFYFTLIPLLAALGAALATSITYTISTIVAAVILAKMYQIKLSDFFYWKEEDRRFIVSSTQSLRRYFAI